MLCYLCGFITDYHNTGLCPDCMELIARNNERVNLLALLKSAQEYCPVWLRAKIEAALEHAPPFVK